MGSFVSVFSMVLRFLCGVCRLLMNSSRNVLFGSLNVVWLVCVFVNVLLLMLL